MQKIQSSCKYTAAHPFCKGQSSLEQGVNGITMSRPTQILYGLVSYDSIVLCDCTVVPGNYQLACQSALNKVAEQGKNPSTEEYIEYDEGEWRIHVYNSQRLHYLCVTSLAFKNSLVPHCLQEVEEEFSARDLHQRAQGAKPYSLRNKFSDTLLSVLSRWSSQDALHRVEKQKSDVEDVIRGAIDKVANRGDTLDSLQDRNDRLVSTSQGFRKTKSSSKSCCCCCFRSQ